MSLEEAVDRTIDECIKENILKDFLVKYRAEARDMCIFEYDEEYEIAKLKKAEREDAFEKGTKAGEKIGEKIGEEKKSIELIQKKILKNKSLNQIADELEEDLEIIKPIYDIIKTMGEEFNCDAVYEKLHEK